MSLSTKDKKEIVEKYFKDAFCAQKAELRLDVDNFIITGIVEIETGDVRGTIYVASATKKEGVSDGK